MFFFQTDCLLYSLMSINAFSQSFSCSEEMICTKQQNLFYDNSFPKETRFIAVTENNKQDLKWCISYTEPINTSWRRAIACVWETDGIIRCKMNLCCIFKIFQINQVTFVVFYYLFNAISQKTIGVNVS